MTNAVNTQNVSPLLDGIGQVRQSRLSLIPGNACIGDADAVLQARLALLGNLLVAFKLSVTAYHSEQA